MARRYRYSFTKKKEAKKGSCLPVWRQRPFVVYNGCCPGVSLDDSFGFLVGGVGLFATLLSVYGFIMGLLSFLRRQKP